MQTAAWNKLSLAAVSRSIVKHMNVCFRSSKATASQTELSHPFQLARQPSKIWFISNNHGMIGRRAPTIGRIYEVGNGVSDPYGCNEVTRRKIQEWINANLAPACYEGQHVLRGTKIWLVVTTILIGASLRPVCADLQPGVPYASSTAPVRIASVKLSARSFHSGDMASGRVITTSNVAALTARIGSYQVNVPRLAPGVFALSLRVPYIPLPVHQVNIVITAIRADGVTAQRTVPIEVHLQ